MDEIMTSSTNRSLIRFLKLLLMTFFVCHFFCCAFVYVGEQQASRTNTYLNISRHLPPPHLCHQP